MRTALWPQEVTNTAKGSLHRSVLTGWMLAATMREMPYQVATLLYCFDEPDHVLLLERAKEPNLGLWSPCGGKLKTQTGESPYACACREAQEELELKISVHDLHLTGLASEHGYLGQSHWLMFLFEVLPKLTALPPPHREGRFQFFAREALPALKLPQTDRERIWPWFWQHRGGFFAAHCHCRPDGTNEWTLEESRMAEGLEARFGKEQLGTVVRPDRLVRSSTMVAGIRKSKIKNRKFPHA